MTPEIIFQSKLDELNLQLNPNYPEEEGITVSEILEYIENYYDHILNWNDRIDEWIRDTQDNYPGYLMPKPAKRRLFEVVIEVALEHDYYTPETDNGSVYNLFENTVAENIEDILHLSVNKVIDRGAI